LIEAYAKSGDAAAAVGGLVGAMKDAMNSARRGERPPGLGNSDG
jgi:hypothetical protein